MDEMFIVKMMGPSGLERFYGPFCHEEDARDWVKVNYPYSAMGMSWSIQSVNGTDYYGERDLCFRQKQERCEY